MLLGIALHAALAYAGIGWLVSDDRTSPTLQLLVAAIHGFRMPLFFLLSGFFTAMLWKRLGLRGMMNQRGKRVLLPLVLGCVTIVPAMWYVSFWAISRQAQAVALPSDANIWSAAAAGDVRTINQLGRDEALLNALDATYGVTALGWTAISDQPEATKALLALGAAPNAPYRDKNTPLHTACFFGRTEVARILLAHGADPSVTNPSGGRPRDAMTADRGTTEFFAKILKVSIDFEKVRAGRDQISALLGNDAPASPATLDTRRAAWINKLMIQPFFHHLWFLWFLWWLVVGFAIVAMIVQRLPRIPLPARLFSVPWCLVWLVPLTMVPQSWMHNHGRAPGFGPDTSAGLIPIPHVLVYYAVFFGFGALVHAARGLHAKLGSLWYVTLPLGLLVLPLALRLSDDRAATIISNPTTRVVASIAAQALYAWLMTFGVIGLFEAVMIKQRAWVRYLSDSSYWLYLVHLPLVIVAQTLLLSLPMPAAAKFILLTLTLTVTLLLTYQLFVRHTRLGVLLNGKRRA